MIPFTVATTCTLDVISSALIEIASILLSRVPRKQASAKRYSSSCASTAAPNVELDAWRTLRFAPATQFF